MSEGTAGIKDDPWPLTTAPENAVGGWYGLRNGYRGRFDTYLPPLLEQLGLAELAPDERNNRVRGLAGR